MRYADLDNLIADYIPEAKSEREKAAVGRILDAASAFVDSYTRRPDGFYASVLVAQSASEMPPSSDTVPPVLPSPTVQRVRGEGQNFLRLPRHIFGTAQLQDAGFVNYYESEKNGWLYRDASNLRALDDGVSVSLNFDGYFDSEYLSSFAFGKIYLVSAVWGYAATPLPIVEAVRLIVARIYSVQKGTIGQVTTEGFIQERLIPQAAKDLLAQFIRREFER